MVRFSFQFAQMLVVDELNVTSRMDKVDTFYRCTFTEFCEALCWLAELSLPVREKRANKVNAFQPSVSTFTDEVIGCMPKDFWNKHTLKSLKRRMADGKDSVMRVGKSPEIDMHETSLEDEG